jgi:hypothetical protein
MRVDLSRMGAYQPAQILGHFIAADESLQRWAANTPVHTDDNALLEFSAPRWVQCAYNPPYLDEDVEEGDGAAPDVAQGGSASAAAGDEDELGGGAWSCPSKPPELW